MTGVAVVARACCSCSVLLLILTVAVPITTADPELITDPHSSKLHNNQSDLIQDDELRKKPKQDEDEDGASEEEATTQSSAERIFSAVGAAVSPQWQKTVSQLHGVFNIGLNGGVNANANANSQQTSNLLAQHPIAQLLGAFQQQNNRYSGPLRTTVPPRKPLARAQTTESPDRAKSEPLNVASPVLEATTPVPMGLKPETVAVTTPQPSVLSLWGIYDRIRNFG